MYLFFETLKPNYKKICSVSEITPAFDNLDTMINFVLGFQRTA